MNSSLSNELAHKALALSLENNYLLGQYEATMNIAVYEGYQGHIEDSLLSAQKAMSFFESGRHYKQLIRCCNILGYLYIVKSDLGLAFEVLIKGIQLSKEHDYDEMLIFFYYNVGEIYKNTLHLYSEALHYLQQPLPIADIESHPLNGALLASIAVCYQKLGESDVAIEYSHKALSYAIQHSDVRTLANCYHLLAITYQGLGQYTTAHQYILEELDQFNKTTDEYGIANANLVLSEIYFAQNDYDKAIKIAHETLEICSAHAYDALVYPLYWVLAQSHEHLQQYDQSSEYYKRYSIAYEKNLTQEVENRISVLSADLRMQERQKELLLKQRNEKLIALADLVTGVAHEINTPLGTAITLCSFIQEELISYDLKCQQKGCLINDQKEFFEIASDALQLLSSSLERTAGIIQNFKSVSTDHHALEPKPIQLHELINDVILLSSPLIKQTSIHIENQCDSEIVIINYERIITQILAHLVENSIKHGFEITRSGLIRISARIDSQKVIINVTDEGMGIEENNLSKIFNPFYTTKKANGGIGLGLNIVHNMVTQLLNGTITVESSLGRGTRFELIFPKQVS